MIQTKLDSVYPDRKNTLSRELREPSNQKYILPESLTLTYKNIEVIDESNISETVKSTPYVHLSHNKLSNLNGITAFNNLQGLSVSHNQLNHWNQLLVIQNPTMIQFLRVRRNPLCRNPNYHSKILEAFPNLQSLDEVAIDEKCLQIKYQTQHGSQALFTQLLKFMQAEFEKIESKMSILYPQIQTNLNQTIPSVGDIDFDFFDLLMAFLNNDPTLKLKKSASSILLGGFLIRLWKMLGSRLLNAPTNIGTVPSAIQIDLLHRILDKYRDRHEHSLEQFLQTQCEENEKVDKERLNSDLQYGYACFLDEIYKISEPPDVKEYLFVKEHLGVSFEGFSQGYKRQESNYEKSQQQLPQQQQHQQSQQQYTFRSELGLSTENAEQYAKEQKNLKEKQAHAKNISELTPKNASYFLHQQEQTANALKQQQENQQEEKRKSSQQTEMLMLRNYFPLFLLNQDYMEVVFECLVEKMISLLIAYELLIYGELEQSSTAVVKKFQQIKKCFQIFDPAEQIFLAIENIGNASNKRQSKQNSKRDDRSAGTIRQISKAEQSILNLKKQSDSVLGTNKDKSRLSVQNEKEEQEQQKQTSAIDELNSTLARINFKRGSQLSRRSSSAMPFRPSQVSFQQQEQIRQSSMIRKQGEQSLGDIAKKSYDQSRSMQNQQEQDEYQQYLDQQYATNAVSNTYETQNNRDIQQELSRQSIKSQKENELERQSNQMIKQTNDDGQIRGRGNVSGNRLNTHLDSSSLENRLRSVQFNNLGNEDMPYRDMVISQQGIWETVNARKQRSLQKAQYFVQILRVILWKRAQETLKESWEHLRLASDKKCELIAKIVSRRQARNALRKWQKRNLKITKHELFNLLHLQKYFNLLRNYTKNKLIIAQKQYATQMQLKVFFGIVRILRNKRKIKKGLRKITRVVRKAIIQPTFEHIVYFYLRIPRNAQEQEIDYGRFFLKSKNVLSQPSVLPQILQSQSALESIRNARSIESQGQVVQSYYNSSRIASAGPETDKQTIQIKDSFRAASQQISDLNNPSRIQPKYSGVLLSQPQDSQQQIRRLIPESVEDNKKTIKPKNDSKNNKNSNIIPTTKQGSQTIQSKDSLKKKALAKLH